MISDHSMRIVKAVQELSLARDMERVMEIVRTESRELAEADGSTFVLREDDMCFYADEDAIGPLWKGSRFPINICISGWAMLNKKPALIEDIYDDDRIPHNVYKPTFVKSLAMIPIRAKSPIGAIGTYWAKKYSPTQEQVTLLQSLADVTAVTIEKINVYNELERRVKDRTNQLEIAKANLEYINTELEAFTYSVSHDLRAPVRSIAGYAQLLSELNQHKLDDRSKRILTVIEENAGQMNNLIDDLLRFSRSGKDELQKVGIDMTAMVHEIANNLKSSSKSEPQINIAWLLDATADPGLLSQVWTNLISNAIKYSSKNPDPIIQIGSHQDENEIVYYVKDNGAGFDMKYIDKLFGVFQRLHDNQDFEGNGVGLALAERIITRHGGRMWAQGKVNEGATFSFTLPAHA